VSKYEFSPGLPGMAATDQDRMVMIAAREASAALYRATARYMLKYHPRWAVVLRAKADGMV
jgi:hypothetical protein